MSSSLSHRFSLASLNNGHYLFYLIIILHIYQGLNSIINYLSCNQGMIKKHIVKEKREENAASWREGTSSVIFQEPFLMCCLEQLVWEQMSRGGACYHAWALWVGFGDVLNFKVINSCSCVLSHQVLGFLRKIIQVCNLQMYNILAWCST